MFKNVASSFMVFAFDSTTNAPKTGDAANITCYVSKDYGAVTVLADTSATEMDATNAKGYYLFAAAQGETNADILMVSAKSATANVVVVGAPAVILPDLPPDGLRRPLPRELWMLLPEVMPVLIGLTSRVLLLRLR